MAGIYGQLIKAQLENLTSDPSSPPDGLMYLKTDTDLFKYYDGTAWRTVANLAGTQVFTNKDYDGGTASDTSRITMPKASTATLAGLTRKQGTIAYDTTLNVPVFDTGSAFSALATAATAQDSILDMTNFTLTASVAGSALTIALKTKAGADPSAGDAVNFAFRNATTATGDYAVVSATAATSVVVSSGSTLGHTSAVATYFYVYAINNAGTIELAVSTKLFDDGSVQSSTAEGGAGGADSASVLYSTTARTDKAIRLLGRLLSTQATAGTWATAITEISLGNSFTPASVVSVMHDTTPTTDTIKSGTYTPTFSNTSNCTVSSTLLLQWMQVGNVVTVSGTVENVNPGSGSASFRMTLPVARATNFSGSTQGGGIAIDTGTVTPLTVWMVGAVNGDSKVQVLTMNSGDPSAQDIKVHFTYMLG